MENMSDLFKKQFNQESNILGLTGIDQAKARKEFTENEKSEDSKREKSTDYLKDGVGLSDIIKLVKNKKLTNNKIKVEIRKLLKEPEELKEFLTSLISKDKTENKESDTTFGDYTGPVGGVIGTRNENKGETKEATGPVSGVVGTRNENKNETKEATASGGSVGAYDSLFGSMGNNESKVKKVETKEATPTASSGAYEGPSIWAKTTNKKNWKPSRKTQIPGGKFVQVKKKCKRFPYCNQGDIKSLNMFENETVKSVIEKVSKTYNLHEDHIKDIILYELRKTNK